MTGGRTAVARATLPLPAAAQELPHDAVRHPHGTKTANVSDVDPKVRHVRFGC